MGGADGAFGAAGAPGAPGAFGADGAAGAGIDKAGSSIGSLQNGHFDGNTHPVRG